MVQLLSRAWRDDLGEVASSASCSVLIAAPFIKLREAVWLGKLLSPGIEVITLANVDPDAVSASALDLAALHHLAGLSPAARLIALGNLHAKVFVADDRAAIVTSGNLTRAALDTNLEYGVLLREPEAVRTVRRDMLAFARLGSRVDMATIAELVPLETELREARAAVTNSVKPSAKAEFEGIIRKAQPEFASAQVGSRSAHAVFGEAIKFLLAAGPQTTIALQNEVKQLMPTLCDDDAYFYIRGERYGRTWKRRFRHAQLHLKRRGEVTYSRSTRAWALSGN